MKEGLYGFLCQFSHGTTPCRSHLIRISEELFYYSLDNELIIECGKNKCDEPIYTITQKGKEERENRVYF